MKAILIKPNWFLSGSLEGFEGKLYFTVESDGENFSVYFMSSPSLDQERMSELFDELGVKSDELFSLAEQLENQKLFYVINTGIQMKDYSK